MPFHPLKYWLSLLLLSPSWLASLAQGLAASSGQSVFFNISTAQGLSNSQVNALCQDFQGNVWMATPWGLNRFDGFRFRTFFNDPRQPLSLPNNFVDELHLSSDGRLWVHSSAGYCVYDAVHERFDSVSVALRSWHLRGPLLRMASDRRGRLFLALADGIYMVDPSTGARRKLPGGGTGGAAVQTMTVNEGRLLLGYGSGVMALVDTQTGQTVWRGALPGQEARRGDKKYACFLDDDTNVWVTTGGRTLVHCARSGQWYSSANDYLASQELRLPFREPLVVKDLADNHQGHVFIASDHHGLVDIDKRAGRLTCHTYDARRQGSIANNSVQSLYVDHSNALWVGCYKNGAGYLSASQQPFHTLPLGDVCTISEDGAGRLWCGTDNSGIVCYDPRTEHSVPVACGSIGLGSEVVVSSLSATDGSVWFGTFNGGMARLKDGRWTAWRADGKGLLNDNVWTLTELPSGRIAVGTLGSGLQILNPATGEWRTISTRQGLPSVYVSSVAKARGNRLLVALEERLVEVDLKSWKITPMESTRSGKPVVRSQINQVFEDSRGIIWLATTSGAVAYDPATDQHTLLDRQSGLPGVAVCSIAEDGNGNIWMGNDNGVTCVTVEREAGQWSYYTTFYNSQDGLQSRQFNLRSILLTKSGQVAVGGQDGLNIIPALRNVRRNTGAHATFSGLVLFEHPLTVGEEYGGRRPLTQSLSTLSKLTLHNKENTFTIQLGTSEVTLPEKSRFRYRLKGLSDVWMTTAAGQGAISFIGVPHGSYKLEVYVINRYGVMNDKLSTLNITILPPWYLSWWALTLYLVALLALAWYARSIVVRRQRIRLKMQQIEMDAERSRQFDEMKLTFFTNVSHELRTPLTLIITPLTAMLKRETDAGKRHTLQIMYANAQQLLGMLTEVLDFRRIEKNRMQLQLAEGDIVGYLRNIVDNVRHIYGKDMNISFATDRDELFMAFDADKVRKMVGNLLSNALKFAPHNGTIAVSLTEWTDCARTKGDPQPDKANTGWLNISVADNGPGVPDADKPHVFERFYQASTARQSATGGSGIGLNIVDNFARLHGGTVAVTDTPGGGATFVITLPTGLKADGKAQLPTVDNIAAPKTETEDVDDAVATEQNAAGHKPSLLLVDDSHDFLDFMSAELSQHYAVRTATNGQEALNRVSEAKPDIILCDVMMPEMDGNEMCRRLKAGKETQQIPIIMLTARLADEFQVESMECGADFYLTKPLNIDLLYLYINKMIWWKNATPGEREGKAQAELKPMEVTSRDQELLNRATEYVDNNLDADIRVEAMAAHLGMSRAQLYKRLISLTGSTPSEFIRQIRIRRGEQLLREGKYSVNEVAYKVGFNVPRYFSKYFKEMYGVSPSDYKR